MGDEPAAHALAQEGIAVATRVGAPRGVAFARYYTTQLYIMAGDAATALTWSERGVAFCDEHGLLGVMGWFRIFRGWATAALGRPNEAIADMTAAVRSSRAAGSRINIPLFNGLLADVEARRGNHDRALELIDDALSQAGEDQIWVSDLHRRRAAALAEFGPERNEAAAEALRTAIRIAESQGAVFFARSAAAALARIEPPTPLVRHDQPSNLSPRERELLSLVGRGLTDKQIAAQLYISLATVRSHLDRIRDKTGRRRRIELTRLADDLGLTGN